VTLLLTLWVLTLFSVFGLSFGREARTDYRLTRLAEERLLARRLALSGVALAEELLLRTGRNRWDAPVEGWDRNPALREIPLGAGRCSLGYSEGAGRRVRSVAGCQDEERRLPLDRASRAMLARLPGLTARGIEALLRFRDAAPPGADPAGAPGLTEGERRAARAYLTTFPSAGVNVNTAPAEVLEALGIPHPLARRIVARRNGPDGQPGTGDDAPFTSVTDPAGGLGECGLGPREGATISHLARAGLLTVRSELFHVRARGWTETGGVLYEVEAVLRRTEGGELDTLAWREDWRL